MPSLKHIAEQNNLERLATGADFSYEEAFKAMHTFLVDQNVETAQYAWEVESFEAQDLPTERNSVAENLHSLLENYALLEEEPLKQFTSNLTTIKEFSNRRFGLDALEPEPSERTSPTLSEEGFATVQVATIFATRLTEKYEEEHTTLLEGTLNSLSRLNQENRLRYTQRINTLIQQDEKRDYEPEDEYLFPAVVGIMTQLHSEYETRVSDITGSGANRRYSQLIDDYQKDLDKVIEFAENAFDAKKKYTLEHSVDYETCFATTSTDDNTLTSETFLGYATRSVHRGKEDAGKTDFQLRAEAFNEQYGTPLGFKFGGERDGNQAHISIIYDSGIVKLGFDRSKLSSGQRNFIHAFSASVSPNAQYASETGSAKRAIAEHI